MELPIVECDKPEGGFVLIKVVQLFSAWWCYEQKQIEFAALRLWFALHELPMRRGHNFRGRTPLYRVEELMQLTGMRRSAVRAAQRQLVQAGLINCTKRSIEFRDRPSELVDIEEFERRLDLIDNNRRRVPMPRLLICMMAKKSRASFVATTLGHALRCLYLRKLRYRAHGNCKASWVAEVFAIDTRSIKRARAKLVKLGILTTHETPLWYQDNYGWRGAFVPEWRPVDRPRRKLRTCRKVSPHVPKMHKTVTPTKPVSLFETLTPIRKAVAGVDARRVCKRLGQLEARHLFDDAETEQLFLRAVHRGVVGEGDRLNVFAAAERAKRRGKKNPAGLFAWLLRNRKWDHITLEEQDAGEARLKAFDERKQVGNQKRMLEKVRSGLGLSVKQRTTSSSRETEVGKLGEVLALGWMAECQAG